MAALVTEVFEIGTSPRYQIVTGTDDPLWPEAPEIVPVQFGWKCPGCGQVYAPFVSKCEYCVPRSYATTTLTLNP